MIIPYMGFRARDTSPGWRRRANSVQRGQVGDQIGTLPVVFQSGIRHDGFRHDILWAGQIAIQRRHVPGQPQRRCSPAKRRTPAFARPAGRRRRTGWGRSCSCLATVEWHTPHCALNTTAPPSAFCATHRACTTDYDCHRQDRPTSRFNLAQPPNRIPPIFPSLRLLWPVQERPITSSRPGAGTIATPTLRGSHL